MPDTVTTHKLTHDGALKLVQAALAKALAIGARENIAVVDAGGNILAALRMDGANYHGMDTALAKAKTAAGWGRPTGGMDPQIAVQQAIATGGARINLPGGYPVVIDGQVAGAIGIGGGTGEEDMAVATAALASVAGAKTF
jgi:glc operon protein GlcG